MHTPNSTQHATQPKNQPGLLTRLPSVSLSMSNQTPQYTGREAPGLQIHREEVVAKFTPAEPALVSLGQSLPSTWGN